MKNKKIYLVFTPFFPTEENFRGPYVFDQVMAIKKNSNYEVIVIKMVSFYEKVFVQEYTYQGVKVYNFKVYDLPSSILPGLFQVYNLYRLKQFIKDIVKINMNDVKFIHSHVIYPAGSLAVELGKQFGVKNFVQHHGCDVFQLSNGRVLKGFLKKINNNFILNKSLEIVNNTDLNIGVSKKVLNQLQTIPNFTNQKMYVLYNGVDIKKFYHLASKIKNDSYVIGCIGNFWKSKDQITLIKAVEILLEEMNNLNIIVKFIGTGIMRQECEAYVMSHKLEKYFEFYSEVDHTKLNTFYNSLNLFVLPSYDEALGCVYMEALQVGIPIIAVKGQGIEDIIQKEHRSKFLIEKEDYKDLSNKIKFFITNPKKLEKKYNLDINSFILDFMKEMEIM